MDKTVTQKFHALCRLLLPPLPGPSEDLGKGVYAEYKRFKDVCWIMRDGAQQEINADLEAGSSTAALHIEQRFLGEVVEQGEAAEDRRAGNHEARMLLGSRTQPGAGVSWGQGWRDVLLQSRPGAVTRVQEPGWEGKRGRACKGRGDLAMTC